MKEENDPRTKMIRLIGSNKRVLEFGCATGYMSKILKENGCTVTGVEIDREAAEKAKKYCHEVVTGDVEEEDIFGIFREESFDVIVLGDFLEHLKDPERLLLTIKPLLDKHGYIVASIPNVAHVSIRLQLLCGKFEYQELGLLDNSHLRFYTKDSIVMQMGKCGYRISHMDSVIKDIDFNDLKPFPEELKISLLEWIAKDPENKVYQYIVKADPIFSNENPSTSIVLLTKNGGDIFRRCLKEIFKQKVNFAYEVIVVDSGSTDSTLEGIKDYPVRLFQIDPDVFKFGPVRDFGFSQARGEYIITLSQDAIPCNEQWLQNLISPFADTEIAVVQGIEITPDSSDVFYWERKGSFYFTREHDRWLKGHDGIGLSFVNVAIRKDIWQRYKFGDVSMSEDKVFQRKLWENGHLIYRAGDAMVYHWHDYTVRTLVKRCENEGLGWRHAGVMYTLMDVLLDISGYRKYISLLKGLLRGEVRRITEVLFPLIRPIFLYIGNRFSTCYKV